MPPEISIIIPNWNGKAFLNRCLGATIQDAAMSGHSYEVILVDDASTDKSGEKAMARFPDIRYIAKSHNEGFGKTVNDGVAVATGSILILMNNDLIPKPGFIKALVDPFKDNENLFGVSGRTVDWEDSNPNHLNMHGRWDDNKLALSWSDEKELAPTMFLQGGSCAIRRDLFIELGGFQPLFYPGYWEDYDISYLALKAGYQNLYQPAAVGNHLGQGSMIRAHGGDRINFVRERNRILFHIYNLSDKHIKDFWNAMPGYVCREAEPRFKQRIAVLSFIWKHRVAIRFERQRRAKLWKLTDSEILEPFQSIGALC